MKVSEPKAGGSDDENDGAAPGSPFDTSDSWIKGRGKAKASREAETSPSAHKPLLLKSSGVLPKMVRGLAHGGKVTWDAQWRPAADAKGSEESECMRLGFLAVDLGDGSIQV